MSVTIFWCEWDEKKTESHELLRVALEQYLGRKSIVFKEGQAQTKESSRNADSEYRMPKNRERLTRQNQKEETNGVAILKGEHGKPFFTEIPQVKFSISHSENLWACAFSNAEVGLDLQSEYMKNGEKIARRFFHPEEIAWMEENGFEHFSRIWTHKESYVKFTGVGLSLGLDYFSVVPWLDGDGEIFPCEIPRVDAGMESGKLKDSEQKTVLPEFKEGAARICQQEIPFREGYWMVLSSSALQEIRLCKLFGNH